MKPLIEGFRRRIVDRGSVRVGSSTYTVVLEQQSAEIYSVSVVINGDELDLGFLQLEDQNCHVVDADYRSQGRQPTPKKALKSLLRSQLQTPEDFDVGIDLSHLPRRVAEKVSDLARRVQEENVHPLDLDGQKLHWSDGKYSVPIGRDWRVVFTETPSGFACTRALSHEAYNNLRKKRQ